MRRLLAIFLLVFMTFSFCACEMDSGTSSQSGTRHTVQTMTEPDTAEMTEIPTESEARPQESTHSSLYISGAEQEDVIRWFQEVCLDAEFVNDGDAGMVQKWTKQISYSLVGAPTQEDKAAVTSMVAFMNSISDFPGMYEVTDPAYADLSIHFVTQEEMVNILSDNFYGCDGGVTIWWDGENQIYRGTICIRTDIDQQVRNSVIKEEIYNGMGPVQDTDLREDSLIYSGYSTPLEPTEIDGLIMTLLYHPEITCGMNATECDSVLRRIYY